MGNYDDIIDLPHYVSKKRKPMSMTQRAAQFAPFAALSGLEEELEETARETDSSMVLEADQIADINDKLQQIRQNIGSQPMVSATFFIPDELKSGGSYKKITGKVRMIDSEKGIIQIDGDIYSIYDITDLFL